MPWARIVNRGTTLRSISDGAQLTLLPREAESSNFASWAVSTGVETTVTLSAVQRNRLKQPYGYCRDQLPLKVGAFGMEECLKACWASYLLFCIMNYVNTVHCYFIMRENRTSNDEK